MNQDLSGSAAVSKYRVPFSPRTYPALGLIISVLHVLAFLIVLGCIGNILAVLKAVSLADYRTASIVVIVLSHLILVVMCIASAESIRLLIDVQFNTQESAHYAKLDHLAQR